VLNCHPEYKSLAPMSRTGTFTISQEDTNSGGALDLRGHLMQAGGPVLTAAYNAGHIASHSAPFLKEAAGTLGLLVGMLRVRDTWRSGWASGN